MTEDQFEKLEKLLIKIEEHVSEIREIQNVDIKDNINSIFKKIENFKNEIITELRRDIAELSR